MKQIITFLLLVFLCKTTSAQQTDSIKFIIKANTKVPKFITDKKLSGCVFVYFKLSEEGVISNIKTNSVFTNEKNAFVNFDFKVAETEAIRILNILPKGLLLTHRKSNIENGKNFLFIPINFPPKSY